MPISQDTINPDRFSSRNQVSLRNLVSEYYVYFYPPTYGTPPQKIVGAVSPKIQLTELLIVIKMPPQKMAVAVLKTIFIINQKMLPKPPRYWTITVRTALLLAPPATTPNQQFSYLFPGNHHICDYRQMRRAHIPTRPNFHNLNLWTHQTVVYRKRHKRKSI